MVKSRVLLGQKIRRLRQTQGLSQEAFADKCGLHRTYMGAIERGERNVSIDNIEKIAAALHITISELTNFSAKTITPNSSNRAKAKSKTIH